MIPLITNNIEALKRICNEHYVKRLYLIGSAARDEIKKTSDIDFLYQLKEDEIADDKYADNFFDFEGRLSSLLNSKIDLVAYDYLKNHFFIQSIEADKKLIYEG